MKAAIRDLGQVGVIYDIPAHDLPPNALTEVSNVSFRDRAITKSYGWTEAFTALGNPLWSESWYDGTNGYGLAVVEESGVVKVYEQENGVLSDITPAPVPAAGLKWDSCRIGNTGVLVNPDDEPYSRAPADAGPLTTMPNWPSTWRAPIIRGYRNFLVALRVRKGAVENDTRVQWSNASDNNSVPPDWDELDPASLAGGVTLAGDGGAIVDGLMLGQQFMIYCKTRTYIMNLVGGPFVMSIRPAFERGLINRHCVVAFDNLHFCVGNGVIYTTNGTAITYMAEDKVQTRFFRELADPNSVHVGHDPIRRVIEIYYKDFRAADDGYPNTILRWDYSNDTWSFDDIHPVGVVKGARGPTSARQATWDNIGDYLDLPGATWNDVDILWQNIDIPVSGSFYQMLIGSAEGPATDGYVVRREPVTIRRGIEFPALIRREKIDFDQILNPPEKTQSIKHVKRILPQIIGEGKVYFRFGVAPTANSPTEWGEEIEYDLASDYKVDFRKSGRYFAWEMTTKTAEPVNFRLTGFDIDVEVAGQR